MNRINRLKRLSLARLLLKYSYWIKKIIFSDEKVFKNNSDAKVQYVNRLAGTGYELKHMEMKKKGSSAADVNVWAYIGPFGKGMI